MASASRPLAFEYSAYSSMRAGLVFLREARLGDRDIRVAGFHIIGIKSLESAAFGDDLVVVAAGVRDSLFRFAEAVASTP